MQSLKTNKNSDKSDPKESNFSSDNSGYGKKWLRNIGLGIVVPESARNHDYIDKKCPFIGKVSIRGRVLKGVVVSAKMDRSIIVRKDYLHWIKKYKRYEKRHKNIPCHCSPCFRISEGDQVTIGQCRPLSKTIRFNVIRIDKKAVSARKI